MNVVDEIRHAIANSLHLGHVLPVNHWSGATMGWDKPLRIEGDMVVMSLTHYAKLQKKLELLNKLSAAQAQNAAGDIGRPLAHVVRDIRKRLRASA